VPRPRIPPISDLHVGVVSTDLGTGIAPVPTCDAAGDHGVLRTEGSRTLAGCNATYPSFLSFAPGVDPSELAMDVACVASAGIGGCGFEHQLDATLKAITPSACTDPWCTVGGTTGHADGANAGFLRDDSLLALVVVSDEEDCSASDRDLYNPTSTPYTGDLRCFSNPHALHPISRFVDGLLATRDDPADLVFTLVAGVPTTRTTSTSTYDEILAAPDMREEIDPSMPTRLRPSCSVPGRGLTFPPRRMVETARALDARGASGIDESICQADLGPATDALLDRIGQRVAEGYE
jgi:hypothetical protein